ncbi:MAG: hypothetical protein WDW36_007211 [Sanguina aurantia]
MPSPALRTELEGASHFEQGEKTEAMSAGLCSELAAGLSPRQGLKTPPKYSPCTPNSMTQIPATTHATLPRFGSLSGQSRGHTPPSALAQNTSLPALSTSPSRQRLEQQQQQQQDKVQQQQQQQKQAQLQQQQHGKQQQQPKQLQQAPPVTKAPVLLTRQVTAPGSLQGTPLDSLVNAVATVRVVVAKQNGSGAIRLAQEVALNQITSSLGPANPNAHKQALQVQMLSDHTFLMEGKFNACELQLRNAITLIAELSGRVQALEGVNADGSRSRGLETRLATLERESVERSINDRRRDTIVAENLETRMQAVERSMTAADESKSAQGADATAAAGLARRLLAVESAAAAGGQRADAEASLHSAAAADVHARVLALERSTAAAAAAASHPSQTGTLGNAGGGHDDGAALGEPREELVRRVALLEAAIIRLDSAVQGCSSSSSSSSSSQAASLVLEVPTLVSSNGAAPPVEQNRAAGPSSSSSSSSSLELAVMATALQSLQSQVQVLNDARQASSSQPQASAAAASAVPVTPDPPIAPLDTVKAVEEGMHAQLASLREWVRGELNSASQRLDHAEAVVSRRENPSSRRPMSSGGNGGAVSSAMLAAIEEQLLQNSDRLEYSEEVVKGLASELREARAEFALLGAATRAAAADMAATRAAMAAAANAAATAGLQAASAPAGSAVRNSAPSQGRLQGSVASSGDFELREVFEEQKLQLQAGMLGLENRMFALQMDRKLSEISYAKIMDVKESENHLLERCGRLQDSIDSLKGSMHILTGTFPMLRADDGVHGYMICDCDPPVDPHISVPETDGSSEVDVVRPWRVPLRCKPPARSSRMHTPSRGGSQSRPPPPSGWQTGPAALAGRHRAPGGLPPAFATADGLKELDETTATSILSLREDVQVSACSCPAVTLVNRVTLRPNLGLHSTARVPPGSATGKWGGYATPAHARASLCAGGSRRSCCVAHVLL